MLLNRKEEETVKQEAFVNQGNSTEEDEKELSDNEEDCKDLNKHASKSKMIKKKVGVYSKSPKLLPS